MSKEPELKARDKVVVRMTREGAVEENLTAGTEQRVSKRPEDVELVKPGETVEPFEALSPEEQKKVQMRRQQRQFQAEHAEDNDTQPPSETSVTEEKKGRKSTPECTRTAALIRNAVQASNLRAARCFFSYRHGDCRNGCHTQAAQDLGSGGSGRGCCSLPSGGDCLRKADHRRCRPAHKADAEARKKVRKGA